MSTSSVHKYPGEREGQSPSSGSGRKPGNLPFDVTQRLT